MRFFNRKSKDIENYEQSLTAIVVLIKILKLQGVPAKDIQVTLSETVPEALYNVIIQNYDSI